MRALTLILVTLLLAGCAAKTRDAPQPSTPTFTTTARHPDPPMPPPGSAPTTSVSPPPAPPVTFRGPVAALPACSVTPTTEGGGQPTPCFEPSIAGDSRGRLFVTSGAGERMARSDDSGRSWNPIPVPTTPDGIPSTFRYGDAWVTTDARGRLFVVALANSPAIRGVQVSRSDDGGASWPVRSLVWPGGQPASVLPGTFDRPWLAFGANDTVFLTYVDIPSGIWSARSDDAGATWSTFTRVAPFEKEGTIGFLGTPIVTREGAVLVPYLLGLAGPALHGGGAARVSLSTDRGVTWNAVDVHTTKDASSPDGVFFPTLAQTRDRTITYAWLDPGNRTVAATSADGGRTWSAPQVWDERDAVGPALGVPSTGGLDAIVVRGAASISFVLQHRSASGIVTQTTAASGVPVYAAGKEAGTDFATGAWLADGCPAVAWLAGRDVLASVAC